MDAPNSTETAGMLLPVASAREVRGYLRGVLRGRWRWPAAAVLAMIAQSVILLLPPFAIGWLTQDVVSHRGTSTVIGPVIVLAAGALGGAVAAWAAGLLLARSVLAPVAGLREEVLGTALDLPIARVEAAGTGDLVARVSGDVETITEATEEGLGEFVAAVLTILSTLIGLASLDWRLALAGLLAVPIQAHTLRWYLRTSRPIYAAGRRAEAARTGALLGVFAALPTVRAYRLEARQRDQVAVASEQAMSYEFAASRAATRFYGRLNLAEFVGLGAILLIGYLLVRDHAISVGAATSAALLFAALFNPINTALGVFDSIQQAFAGLGRLVGVLRAADSGARRGRPATDAAARVVPLVAEEISFGYRAGLEVLHRVDLRLEPGRHVAVVGTSGSGKSTLAALLAGMRQPGQGLIRLDGVDLASLDPAALRPAITLITQETHLFAGTIADNLRLGCPTADDAQLHAALAAVGAAAWVDALPAGMHTRVGAGGQPLTASRTQHLALARVLLLDPQVVIMDEATAEAGSDAARLLDAAAERVIAGRAAVLIAHRLGQAATAEEIMLLEHGRVLERGTHAELSMADGRYALLWQAWREAGGH